MTLPQHPIIASHTPCRLGTGTWLIYHRVVCCATSARAVYPLYSHPIPLNRPPATAKLPPCTAGSSHPCTGKSPGPSLSALPPLRDFFSYPCWESGLRRRNSQNVVLGYRRQTVCEARVDGTVHRTLDHAICSSL